MTTFSDDIAVMQRALEIARSAQGNVEPNPCVGAVIVNDQLQLLGEGCHERFGGPHAEVMAIRSAGELARGGTLFVTLEPCNHHGKTPPCSEAVIAAGIRRVVIATSDPIRHTSQSGADRLRDAGVEVHLGLCETEAKALIAPFTTLYLQQRPYVHAKWAMTLDGKIASRTGDSKWISNELSRAAVHQLRGRMDAIVTGIGTVLADDPLLTARPPGRRTPLRIVLDSTAQLPLHSQLVNTSRDMPVLVATTLAADGQRCQKLQAAGVEVLQLGVSNTGKGCDLLQLMRELGRRRLTNVLIEAGGQVLGSFFDAGLIDEVHCWIAPRLIGGTSAATPLAGLGGKLMSDAAALSPLQVQTFGDNVLIEGQLKK